MSPETHEAFEDTPEAKVNSGRLQLGGSENIQNGALAGADSTGTHALGGAVAEAVHTERFKNEVLSQLRAQEGSGEKVVDINFAGKEMSAEDEQAIIDQANHLKSEKNATVRLSNVSSQVDQDLRRMGAGEKVERVTTAHTGQTLKDLAA